MTTEMYVTQEKCAIPPRLTANRRVNN